MPVSPSDHEGMYEGLRWVVRGLEECGRAFSRVTSRVNRMESRLSAVEETVAGFDERLRQLEQAPKHVAAPAVVAPPPPPPPPAPPVPAPVVPLRVEAQLSSLRKDIAAATARLSKIEAQPFTSPHVVRPAPAPAPPPAPSPSPNDVGPRMVAMAARVGALEADMQGLYRELDQVAELVADRFSALDQRLDGMAPVDGHSAAAAEPPAAPQQEGESQEVRAKAASVLISELERISHALGVLSEVGPRST